MQPARPLLLLSLPLLTAIAGLLVALTTGCSSAERVATEQIEVAGFAGYAPVPSDGLAIRRADFDGRTRLAIAVQGHRYQLLRGQFRLAVGAFSDIDLMGHTVPARDVCRIGMDRMFVVRSAVPMHGLYSDEQRLVLTEGLRYELLLTLNVNGDTMQPADGSGPAVAVEVAGAEGPITLDRLRGALDEGLRQALRMHHREGALQASGRLFVLRFRPELEPDPEERLPADPGDSPVRDTEYRYRTGQCMRPTTGLSIRFRLVVVVIADRIF